MFVDMLFKVILGKLQSNFMIIAYSLWLIAVANRFLWYGNGKVLNFRLLCLLEDGKFVLLDGVWVDFFKYFM